MHVAGEFADGSDCGTVTRLLHGARTERLWSLKRGLESQLPTTVKDWTSQCGAAQRIFALSSSTSLAELGDEGLASSMADNWNCAREHTGLHAILLFFVLHG